jgi:hypothetical protein
MKYEQQTPLEVFVAQRIEAARLRLYYAIDLRAEADHATIRAMAVCRQRGLGQLFRHARRRVREIQQGAAK